MATKRETVDELKAKIKQLEDELAFEKKLNRKMAGVPEDTPAEDIKPSWSTEWMQDEMDRCEVTDGAVTKVYDQYVLKLIRSKDGKVQIRYHNGKRAKKELWRYKKVKFTIPQEVFFMMLELMKFAEREFDLNQKEVIDKLTDGKEIEIRRSINGFW